MPTLPDLAVVRALSACTPATCDKVEMLQMLIHPTNLATPEDRRANQRVQEVTAIVNEAKAGGQASAKNASETANLSLRVGWWH